MTAVLSNIVLLYFNPELTWSLFVSPMMSRGALWRMSGHISVGACLHFTQIYLKRL